MASSSFNLSLASTVDDSLADSFPSDKDSSTSMVNNPEPDHPLRADLAGIRISIEKLFPILYSRQVFQGQEVFQER